MPVRALPDIQFDQRHAKGIGADQCFLQEAISDDAHAAVMQRIKTGM